MTVDDPHAAPDRVQDTTTAGEPQWEPRGHVVGWAAAVVVVAVAVLGVSYAFGLLTPRVGSGGGFSAGPLSVDDRTVAARFAVTNRAYADTRLLSVGSAVPGLRVVGSTITPSADAVSLPDGAVVLGHGDAASVEVVWQVIDCGRIPADPPPILLEMRTPVGLPRTIDFHEATIWLDDLHADGATDGWAQSLARGVCDPA